MLDAGIDEAAGQNQTAQQKQSQPDQRPLVALTY